MKSVLNYKKPAFWIIIAAIVASIVVAVCFLTDPASNTLENIEFLNFAARRENTVSVLVSDGETYTPVAAVNQDLLKELCNIKISKNEISRNRSEERDKTHTLVLQTAKDTEPTIYSHVEGWQIHFDSTFTSVWVNNNVKPTLSYRVIDPLQAKKIYEDISNYAGLEKFTWTYNPGLSHTAHYTRAFSFELDYTHVVAACTNGEMWNLEAEGQPKDTTLRFEKNQHVYWTPSEGVIGNVPQKSEVILTIYNNETQLHKCTVVFECVSRNNGEAEFEIYLKDADGLALVPSDDGMKFVKRSSISNVGGADGPVNVITSVDMDQLKAKFPNYFGLSTTKGLEVYIWQMAEGSYSCGLLSGKNLGYTQEELWNLHTSSASMDEMRAIVANYMANGKVTKSDIVIHAIGMPHSSYAYTIDDEYRQKLNELFWSKIPIVENSNWTLIIDEATFDIDDDGKNEQCTIGHGPTSGLHTFKLSVWEIGSTDNKFEYVNVFQSDPGDLSFVETDEGMKLRLEPQSEALPKDYSFSVKDGNIVLSTEGESLGYWGEQGVGTVFAARNSSELYETTSIGEIEAKYDNEEFVITKMHYKDTDGMWACEGYSYKYRLEITGRTHNASKNSTYIVLSNTKDITFDQTWRASGLSSLTTDYFDPSVAVIVGNKLFS